MRRISRLGRLDDRDYLLDARCEIPLGPFAREDGSLKELLVRVLAVDILGFEVG